ncbi:hypothetical protein U1Q18_019569 [Sarracenia purpurea var. burkii]
MIEVKEEECIVDVTSETGFASYSPVSDSSCDTYTPRSPLAQGLRRLSGPTRRSSQAGWTEEEDNLLGEVVKKYNGRNWKQIGEASSSSSSSFFQFYGCTTSMWVVVLVTSVDP